mmetsp:Transcript_3984/g.10301  ORF Transcript_3984/g.10301 Transcript_3984/m.10301 type:complete len:265 (+) Transcript_3984:307-1101(+)
MLTQNPQSRLRCATSRLLRARIGGGDRSVQANAPLNLDASSSADPSALPSAEAMAFGFAWSVSWQRNSSEAAEAGGDEEFEAVALPAGQGSKAVLVLPAGWLAVGDYLASVAILSANGRGANASVSINAVSAPVPRVTLVPLPGKPSADDRLVLRALAVTIDDADAAAVALVAAGLATSAADALARNVQANELPWAYTWVGYSDSANRAQLDLNDPAVSSTGPGRRWRWHPLQGKQSRVQRRVSARAGAPCPTCRRLRQRRSAP